ncbi:bowman-birk serine protease inhibitor family protein (macronuclear) [Tetrahymena thermophila SB210]|uniref:Bowman-birk serine protease inhibitor family protein n=1 Tax=Tetrahymena thermophila (strain SB210) TaxID=312017 RepID=W7X4K0_TETTS|nr:bowman-birk serine protease inhibitor family protein [Tetrahymena thermophila SB210]EWS71303.1 bowman-birk serine protease inhibitor family protein [Tetrahymena thermophila SB210]|eukprot:XP_012656167.1 bowman-birk serine protease inhibitor family protein [Tetrahymena thermophila SB210]
MFLKPQQFTLQLKFKSLTKVFLQRKQHILILQQSHNYQICSYRLVYYEGNVKLAIQHDNCNTFTSQLLSGAFTNLNYVTGGAYALQQKWYFAVFKMEVILGSQIKLQSYIYESQSSYFYLQQNTSSRNTIPFTTSGMDFNFGKGESQHSCILVKLVYIYWDSDLLDTSMFGLINDITVSDINLKWSYDTFYTQQQPGYLVQTNQPNGKLYVSINRAEQLILKNKEQIYTEFINVTSNGGFVLTFHFKLESQNPSANQIVILQINNVNLKVLNNYLYFFDIQISGVQLSKWNQITIVYRQLFYNQIHFIVNDDQATYTSNALGSNMYSQVQAVFGDSSITNYFLYLNYIRVYEGIFLSNSPSCYMLAARKNQQCIICKSSYLIDYQNGINCVSTSLVNKSTIIDNVKDWFPKQYQCPQNMILNSQNICVCFYNSYRYGDQCSPCQSYCQGCIDGNTCIQKDPLRDINGKCLNSQFDDGYKCLGISLNIKNRQNILKTFLISDFGDGCTNTGTPSDYIIPQSQLNLAKGVGFFFSFSIKFHNPHTQGTIAVLSDGPNDLFTIILDQITQNGLQLPCIKFYVLNVMTLSVTLSSYDEVWIGLWSSFVSAQFFIFTDWILYSSNQINFEVFCNYQREVMIFIIQQQNYYSSVNIDILPLASSPNIQDYSIYLNKIRIEVGNGSYYYDQTIMDNCFLYRNIENMECKIPKRGYVFYQTNTLITEQACNDRTQIYNSFHVINPSTQTCIDTQLSPYCQQIDEIQSSLICTKCLYPGQDPAKNCQCEDGYFFNNQDLACQNCSPRCKTCVNSHDNCLICNSIDQSPPKCECNQSNYFLDKSNSCTACSSKCSACEQSSELCLACSNNRAHPPTCDCIENHVEINNYCQLQTCDLKCLTCESSKSNCIKCKEGRENPPACNCMTNFVENSDGTCSLCNFGNYFDKGIKNCLSCSIQCLGCIDQASNCLACQSNLIQTNNECSCQTGKSFAKIKNEVLCLKNMDVRLTVILQSNRYILQFKFDEDIQQIDNKYLNNIESLIKITFSEIPMDAYKIGNPIIKNNILSVQLIVNQSFSTKQGWVLFLDNTQFISVSEQYVLNRIYTVNLINFQIGPLIFDRNTLDAGQLDQINDYYKNSNQDIFNIIKQFQIILYILNSAQPTALYILLDAKFPPNLYKFYQVVGLIIYPDVVDYQTSNFKQDFKLFQFNLNQSEVYPSDRITYKRLGLCNTFLQSKQQIVKMIQICL